jgi:predicted flap endonuclease-1-like 5' DNA nuclease
MLFSNPSAILIILLQESSGVSPIILGILAVLMIGVFFWVLTSEPKTGKPVSDQPIEPEEPADNEVLADNEQNHPGTVPPESKNPDPEQAFKAASIGIAAVTSAQPEMDDLEIIEGIGPKVAAVLRQAGVTTFAQLAEMEPSQILEILHAANLRLADPQSWPEQARLAASGDRAGLQALQERLKGGREK